MNYQNDPRRTMAQELDALTGDLQTALDGIDAAIARMDSTQLFNTLSFVRKYGDLTDPHHRILLEKLTEANAAHAARGDHVLDLHLARPDPSYRRNWQVTVMAGHITVALNEFPTFEEGKAAFDALCEFIRIAGREGQFTYETPRPADGGRADSDLELPF